MSMLLKTLAGALLLYAVIVVALFVFQRRILFVPDPVRVQPAAVGLADATVESTRTADGLDLEGWWLDPQPNAPVILYLQGNGGNIAGRADKAAQMQEKGYGVLLAGYRGYGGNPGTPSEAGLIADGRAWIDHLQDRGVSMDRLVLYGESLGTGVASALAVETRPAAIVLEAPFTSIRETAQRQYWFVPVRLLLRDPFESLRRVPRFQSPLLVLHGAQDDLIPVRDGERVFEAAPEPKRFVIVNGGRHSDLFDHGALDAVEQFLVDNGIVTLK